MGITCCHNCQERQLGCHSTCKKYISEKAEDEKRKEKIRKAKSLENALDFGRYARDNKRKKKYI